jgi:hypothetical protein
VFRAIDVDTNSNIIVGGSTSDSAMVSGGEIPIAVLFQNDGQIIW